MFFRNKELLIKTESSYGVDSTPATTDAVLTKNLSIVPYGGPTISRGEDRSTFGAQTLVNTGPNAECTFEVELAASGTAGDEPAWADILRACGFEGTEDSGVSWTYTPVSTGFESVTLKYYLDGQEHKILGARGNVSFTLSRGVIPTMAFRFLGFYTTPSAVAVPSGVKTDYISPLAVTYANTPTFSVHGTASVCESFTLDMANTLVHRNLIGAENVFITNRSPNGSMVIEAPAIGTKNWFSSVESDSGVTTGAVNLVHGTTSGNIITLSGPAVQLTALGISGSDDIVVYNLSTLWVPSSGNDEVSIKVE